MALDPKNLGPPEEYKDEPGTDEDQILGDACNEAIELIEARTGKTMMDAVICVRVDEGDKSRGAIAMMPKNNLPRILDFLLNNVAMLAQEAGGHVEIQRHSIPVEHRAGGEKLL